MDLYILSIDNEEYTYNNVVCFTFDIVNHDFVICWRNKENIEMVDRINDERVRLFTLA